MKPGAAKGRKTPSDKRHKPRAGDFVALRVAGKRRQVIASARTWSALDAKLLSMNLDPTKYCISRVLPENIGLIF